MEATDKLPFEDYLGKHDEQTWVKTLDLIHSDIHQIDRDATQIWFSFWPLKLAQLLDSLKPAGVPDTIAYLTENEVLGVEEKLEELGYDREILRAALHAPPQPVDYFHFFFKPDS